MITFFYKEQRKLKIQKQLIHKKLNNNNKLRPKFSFFLSFFFFLYKTYNFFFKKKKRLLKQKNKIQLQRNQFNLHGHHHLQLPSNPNNRKSRKATKRRIS